MISLSIRRKGSCRDRHESNLKAPSTTSSPVGIIAKPCSSRTTITGSSCHCSQREKRRHPFYLYAYVLMTNHVHLLIERQPDPLSGLMQRVLTGYAQYWNRAARKVGHVFQGRYQAILCQKDAYLSELVRYIHLNPVRAKMVRRAEDYRWSSHRVYLGLEKCRWVDSDEGLRYFGARRKRAVESYRAVVRAGYQQGHRAEFYGASDGRLLGGEEFVGEVKHRIGEVPVMRSQRKKEVWDWSKVVRRVEAVVGVKLKEIEGRGKAARQTTAKEVMMYVGRERGGVRWEGGGETAGTRPLERNAGL
jgi:REP element-mobilizing transposase RayT